MSNKLTRNENDLSNRYKVYVVTYYDDGQEPTITLFNNKAAADKMTMHIIDKYDHVLNEVAPLFGDFLIGDDEIGEYKKLKAYREPKVVKPYAGYAGQCPTCGAVFLDGLTRFCGNCGQAILLGDGDG